MVAKSDYVNSRTRHTVWKLPSNAKVIDGGARERGTTGGAIRNNILGVGGVASKIQHTRDLLPSLNC